MGNVAVNGNKGVSYRFEYFAGVLGLSVPDAQAFLKDYSKVNKLQSLLAGFSKYRQEISDTEQIDMLKSLRNGIDYRQIALAKEAQDAGIPYSELKGVFEVGNVKKYITMKNNDKNHQSFFANKMTVNAKNGQKSNLMMADNSQTQRKEFVA